MTLLTRKFAEESNKIEGIYHTTPEHVEALEALVFGESCYVKDIINYVNVIQPDAQLREHPTLNVRVGAHVAPQGGPQIRENLSDIIMLSEYEGHDPYTIHQMYENLHPFTDGNGRSGRALWARQMVHIGRSFWDLGFLHTWYYQSLAGQQRRKT